VLESLESQNEDHAGEMSKKVRMLKDVSFLRSFFVFLGGRRREVKSGEEKKKRERKRERERERERERMCVGV
jgi:hypothetical protein